MSQKNFLKSKTLWVNALSLLALIIQSQTTFVFDPVVQAEALVIINAALRIVTKGPIKWN